MLINNLAYFAGRGVIIHYFLEENRSVAHVVAGDQAVCIVHASWVHGEPIYDAQRLVIRTDELDLC